MYTKNIHLTVFRHKITCMPALITSTILATTGNSGVILNPSSVKVYLRSIS